MEASFTRAKSLDVTRANAYLFKRTRRFDTRYCSLLLVAVFSLLLLGSGANAWAHKAVSDVGVASKIVGGFSPEQSKLYRSGLLHIQHQHQRPGQYTIGQVIQAERSREHGRKPAPRADMLTPSSQPGSGSITGVLIATVILAVLIVFQRLKSRAARENALRIQSRNQAIHDEILGHAERGDFPVLHVDINIGEGEKCYFTCPCSYAIMTNVNHTSARVGISFQIARGVRIGSYQRLPSSKDMMMASQDRGTLYLTNKRVIFIGATTSNSFNWSRILQITPFDDGVRYEISNHRPIQFSTPDVQAAMMSVVLLTKLEAHKPQATIGSSHVN